MMSKVNIPDRRPARKWPLQASQFVWSCTAGLRTLRRRGFDSLVARTLRRLRMKTTERSCSADCAKWHQMPALVADAAAVRIIDFPLHFLCRAQVVARPIRDRNEIHVPCTYERRVLAELQNADTRDARSPGRQICRRSLAGLMQRQAAAWCAESSPVFSSAEAAVALAFSSD